MTSGERVTRWERVYATIEPAERPPDTTRFTIELLVTTPAWCIGTNVTDRYGAVVQVADSVLADDPTKYGRTLDNLTDALNLRACLGSGIGADVHGPHYSPTSAFMHHLHAVVTWPDGSRWCYPDLASAVERRDEVLALWTAPPPHEGYPDAPANHGRPERKATP